MKVNRVKYFIHRFGDHENITVITCQVSNVTELFNTDEQQAKIVTTFCYLMEN